jgi:hypothetical protein
MEAPYDTFSELADETSAQFVGRWQRLVSTTNWEKGRIIAEWRQALVDAGAQVYEYSDEAWSRRLGNISSQHTGRLRRTYARFGATYPEYPGLYWSHFQAALDWDDAEMWLEGAVQNEWSVADMRQRRVETLGAAAPGNEDASEIVSEELDADTDSDSAANSIPRAISPTHEVIADTDEVESDDDGFDADEEAPFDEVNAELSTNAESESTPEAVVRPFARLADLPPDLADAFEAFKLAILRHKLAGWNEVSCDDVVATLHSLEELALAPSANERHGP